MKLKLKPYRVTMRATGIRRILRIAPAERRFDFIEIVGETLKVRTQRKDDWIDQFFPLSQISAIVGPYLDEDLEDDSAEGDDIPTPPIENGIAVRNEPKFLGKVPDLNDFPPEDDPSVA
jgi:hypothetical protein